MQVVVEDVSALTKKLKVVLPAELVAKKIGDAYQALSGKVAIKGFRKGKVPQHILEKTHGEQLKQDVADKLVQDTYFDALEQVKLDAVVHPEIKKHEYSEDGSFVYEAEVDVRPKFELGQYKGLAIEHPEVAVSDVEIDREINQLRRDMAPLRTVAGDRPAQLDDVAIIDFQAFDSGKLIKQVGAVDYTVDLGAGRNGKEFEARIIGMKKGDKDTMEVPFPPSFPNPLLAGKKVEFLIEVKDVKERVPAALDDEFAKDVNEEFQTVADLKKSISERLLKQKKEAEEGDLSDKLMLKLLENNTFEVPNRLVAYEVNELINQFEAKLKQQGMTLELAGVKTDDLVKQYRESAERRVRGDFVLKAIAKQESVTLSDEDIAQGFARIADEYGMTVDEVKKYFRKREELLPFMNEMLNEKILKLLREHAVITPVPAALVDTPSETESGAAA
ncbi:MAG: trigger factor [Deltaproteobacteria bacterium RIFOXYD12_FULL_50_9]|nr:MAG: trigger factor [Deltaproteobacteria bacterium RIFOXYD12_FULL_50_9]